MCTNNGVSQADKSAPFLLLSWRTIINRNAASLRNVKLKSVVNKYSLLELSQDIGNVGRGGQANHDVQLLQFHIDGVIVLDKEHLDVLFQDLGPEVGKQ